MGLEAGFPPNAMDHRLADAKMVGELAARPMRGAVTRLAAGGVEDAGSQFGGQLGWRLTGPLGFQTVQSGFEKTPLPLSHRTGRGIELVGDADVRPAVAQQQHDLGSYNKPGR